MNWLNKKNTLRLSILSLIVSILALLWVTGEKDPHVSCYGHSGEDYGCQRRFSIHWYLPFGIDLGMGGGVIMTEKEITNPDWKGDQ